MFRSLSIIVACCACCSFSQAKADESPKTAKPQPVKSGAAKPGATLRRLQRWEFPCKGAMPDHPQPGANCDSAIATGDPKKTDNFTRELDFGGAPGKHYKVALPLFAASSSR